MALAEVTGFDWDEANVLKNWEKHKVKHTEAEEVFENKPRIVSKDAKHSLTEPRYQILGITNQKRKLSVIFTLRDGKVRVISARDMNRKEKAKYEEAT
ncbi:MAG TPA: BrnT family toxin [Candidatus Nanoarchaeia archaeon]